jgi:hypothetical protein
MMEEGKTRENVERERPQRCGGWEKKENLYFGHLGLERISLLSSLVSSNCHKQ